jgi:transposase
MSRRNKNLKRPDVRTEDMAYDYYELLLQPPEIGIKYGLSPMAVRHRLKMAGYILRSPSKAQLIRKHYKHEDLPSDEVVDRYVNQKMSVRKLGKEYGVSWQTITRCLLDKGIVLRKRGELRKGVPQKSPQGLIDYNQNKPDWFDIKEEDLRVKYLGSHMTMKEIGKEYGCGIETIKDRLIKYNIPIRSKWDRRKKVKTKKEYVPVVRPPEYYQLPEGEPEEGRVIDGKLIGRGNPYTWHYCQDCGAGRWVESRWLRESVYKGKCLPCIQKSQQFRKNMSEGMFARYADPDEREKTSLNSERMWASDPVRKERQTDFLRWVAINPDVCKKKSDWSRAFWDDPEWGEYRREKNGKRLGKISKRLWENPIHREKMTEKAKSMYATPERKDKQIKAMRQGAQIKPTRPEMHLMDIFNDLYPNQWKYVGDGEVVMGGKNPDFINVDGKKQVAELFGTYYHSQACNGECPLMHELERKDGYAKFGHDTLVIWEHELKDEKAVRHKVLEFCNSEFVEKI